MILNKDKNLDKEYSGEVIITSAEETFVSIPVSLSLFEIKEEVVEEEEKIEEEIIEEEPEFGVEEEKKGHGWIWLVVILFIVIIGVIGFVLFKSKKIKFKEKIGDLLEKE